jgi:hypothetical protein
MGHERHFRGSSPSVCLPPNSGGIADIPQPRLRATTGINTSLNHLVGADEQRWRDLNPERLCGFEIEDSFILGGCLHRQVGGLGTTQDPIDISRCLSK